MPTPDASWHHPSWHHPSWHHSKSHHPKSHHPKSHHPKSHHPTCTIRRGTTRRGTTRSRSGAAGSCGIGHHPRQRANARGDIGPGCERGNESLDLARALVPGTPQDVAAVLRRQMPGEQVDRAQVQLAAFDHLEDDREATRRAGGPDPLGGHLFRHVEALDAEDEHRWAGVPRPQLALVDLGDRDE